MTRAIILALALVILALIAPSLRSFIKQYLKYRGTRVVPCPETHRPATVEVAAAYAARTAVIDGTDLRLKTCSRWPERGDCGQECLLQIEASPEGWLVKNMLTKWYQGKFCIYCLKPFGEINWTDPKPAFRSLAGKMLEWHEIRPEQGPEVLDTHLPVCWDCYITESFRQAHPDLVVDRPWRK